MTWDDLKVYWTLAEAAPQWDGLAWLSAYEIRRLEGMRFPKRRSEWLRGRAAAKSLLCACLDDLREVEPARLSIQNDPDGAPILLLDGQKHRLSLSISHRDGLAFCAVCEADGVSLGADVERVERRSAAFAGDYFTPAELESMGSLFDGGYERMVTLIWSAKEAALKALGKGLRLDTRSVEIRGIRAAESGWGSFSVRCGLTAGAWRGWWQARGEYILTLATLTQSGDRAAIRLVEIDQHG